MRLDLDDLVQIQENPWDEPSYEDQLMGMLNESAWENKPAGVEESAVNEVVEALSLICGTRARIVSKMATSDVLHAPAQNEVGPERMGAAALIFAIRSVRF